MSTIENSRVRVSDLDFDSIKTSFKEYLKTQGEFADYDFEASGLSILLDTLSYNTYYNSVLANFIANETYIDSAVKRDSVVSHAKALGYRPKSVKASKAKLQMSLTNAIGEPNQLVMKAGTPFETTVREQTFQFVTLSDVVAAKDNGVYNFGEFDIYQGKFQQNTYIAEGLIAEKFTLPNSNVDTSSIQVIVQKSGAILDYEYWTHSDTIVDVDGTSNVFFIQEGVGSKTEIYFGDGIIGKRISAGNIVIVTYLTSDGQNANDAKVFKLTGSIEGNNIVSIQTISQSSGGADAEDVDSIRFNAMSYFGVQNRCVTADDYKAVILQNFQNAKNVITWGGEKQSPPEYGKIFICVQPKNTDYLTDTEKLDIDGIVKKRAVANIKTKFINPEYVDLEIDVSVYYNILRNNKNTVDLKNIVLSAITQYSDDYLGKFDDAFRSSQLSRIIDGSDYAITNNLTAIKVYKSYLPIINTQNSITLSFFNAIQRIEGAVTSTGFYIEEISEKVYAQNDALGNIQLYYYDVNGAIKTYRTSVGTVNFNTSVIQLTPLNITNYDGNEIRFYIKPVSVDVVSKNNSIVRLQQTNVNINVYSDKIGA